MKKKTIFRQCKKVLFVAFIAIAAFQVVSAITAKADSITNTNIMLYNGENTNLEPEATDLLQWKGHNLYWGNDTSSNWQILDTASTQYSTNPGMLILSGGLGETQFNPTLSSGNIYEGSTLDTYLNIQYTNRLSTDEKRATLNSTNTDESEYMEFGGLIMKDQVFTNKKWFAPTGMMMLTTGYGFSSDGKAEDKARGTNINTNYWSSSRWSTGKLIAGRVHERGDMNSSGVSNTSQARGASNIDTKSLLFISAAVGGKPNTLQPVSATATKEWKLTLKDSSQTVTVTTVVVDAKDVATITYNKIGAGTKLSAIVTDKTGKTIKSYGKIATITNTDLDNQKVTVQLPNDFFSQEYKLKVLTEIDNGDKKTDFASETVDVNVVEPEKRKVSYDSNGGTGNVPEDTTVYIDGDIATIDFSVLPTKVNYNFLGWDSDATVTTPTYTKTGINTMIVNGNMTLYAIWKEKTNVLIDETPQHYSFDATSKEFSIKGTPTTGFTVKYQQNGVDITPKEIGSYEVIITRVEDGQYSSYSKTITGGLVIDKINFVDYITVENYKGVYDGLGHSVTITLDPIIQDATITYYSDATYTSVITKPSPKNAEMYTVYFKATRQGMDDWKSSATTEITKASLDVYYDGETITFNETPTVGIRYGRFVNGETQANLNQEPTLPTLPTKVGIYTITPQGGNDNNYQFVYHEGILVINKATFLPTEIVVTNYNGVYDGLGHELGVQLSGRAIDATATYQIGSEEPQPKIEKKDVGSYQIRYRVNKEGYNEYQGVATIQITSKQVEVRGVEVDDKVYDGTKKTKNPIFTLEGVIAGETIRVEGEVNFTSKEVGTDKTLEVESLVVKGSTASNYVLKDTELHGVASSASITPKEVHLIWNGLDPRVYDGSVSNASASTSDVVAGEVLRISVANGIQKNAGTHTATASVTDTNYRIQSGDETSSYIINKAMLTVTYKGSYVIYKDKAPVDALACEMTGFVSGEGKTEVSSEPIVSLPAGKTWDTLEVGTYPLTPSGGVATNYDFSYVKGDLVILSRAFNVLVLQDYVGDYDGASHGVFTKNEDVLASNLKLRYYEDEEKMKADNDGTGGSATPTSRTQAGETKVYVKAFNPNFTPKEAILKITINKRKITPTIINIESKEYDGKTTAVAKLVATNGVVGDDLKLQGTIEFVDRYVGDNKAVKVTNLVTTNSNYEVTTSSLDVSSSATIRPKAIVIGWKNASKAELVYSGTTKNVKAEVAAGQLIDQDICDVQVIDGNKKDAGNYVASATLSNSNYSIKAENTKAYEITKQEVTVKYKDEEINYGQAPLKQLVYTGFVGGENESNLSSAYFVAPTIKTNPIPTEAIETPYIIELQGGSAKNYNVNLDQTGTLTIHKQKMPITTSGYQGIYDSTSHGILISAPAGADIKYFEDEAMTKELQGGKERVRDAQTKTIYYQVTHPNYATEKGKHQIIIKPKEVTPVIKDVQDKVYDGSSEAVATMEVIGAISNEDVKLEASVHFNNQNVEENKIVIASNMTTKNPNYKVSTTTLQQPTNAKIKAKPVTIEWQPGDMVYSGTNKQVGAIVKEVVEGDTCIVQVIGGNGKDVKEYQAIALLENTNYQISNGATYTYTITKKPLLISYKEEAIYVGETPKGQLLYEEFVEQENESNAKGFVKPTWANPLPKEIGTQAIALVGGVADNYEIVLKDTGLLIILKEDELVITIGDGFVYELNSGVEITLRCTGKLEDFIDAYIDGKLVDKSNYSLQSGSTIITFHKEYLDTLRAGSHSLRLSYTKDRFVDTVFHIEKDSKGVDTGVSTGQIPFGILCMASVVVGTFVYSRKRKIQK